MFEGVLEVEAVTDGVMVGVFVFVGETVSVWTGVTDGLTVLEGV